MMSVHIIDSMCESRVIVRKGEEEDTVMDAAAHVRFLRESIICRNITGEEVMLDDVEIKEINLIRHEIILERRSR